MSRFLPSGVYLFLLDILVALLVIASIGIGVAVRDEVRNLKYLPETIVTAGVAIDEVGDTIDTIGSIPLIGKPFRAVSGHIHELGDDVQHGGREAHQAVDRLAVLFGIVCALIVIVPMLLLYLPLRIARMADRINLQRVMKQAPDYQEMQRLVGQRALLTLSYSRLHKLGPDLWTDIEESRWGALAAIEFERLGLKRNVNGRYQ